MRINRVNNMARNYTSINHCALSSDTLAEANDATQALFWRLLCVSDDWGRFPNNPAKLKRMMQDFSHSEDQIAEAVKHFDDHDSIDIYEIDGVAICEWIKWDEYQTMRWKNEAELPNREGQFEASTNPLSDRPAKKKHNKSKHNISYHNKADDDASVSTNEDTKDKHKTVLKTEKAIKPDLPGWCVELVKELFPKLKDEAARKQAETIEQLFRLDSYTRDDIEQVLRWAKTDTGNGNWPGWSAQFLSCGPLRVAKKKNDAHKFAKMKAGYKSSEGGSEDDFFKKDKDY